MLPGLAPNHTRGGFTGGNRLHIETCAPNPEDYIRTNKGLWLLPAAVAQRENDLGIQKTIKLAAIQTWNNMPQAPESIRAARILEGSIVNTTGCLVGGLSADEDPNVVALDLAERAIRTFSLDTIADIPFLRICDDAGCYNPRHFDLSFGRPTLRERKVELNPDWYEVMPSGRIKTLWGDKLPSVAKSLEEFIKFQRRNFPFVPRSKAVMTTGSVSQVRFHPVTGCWQAWSYYCRSTSSKESWQYDGYGRLHSSKLVTCVDPETAEITIEKKLMHLVAHRAVWNITPRRSFQEGMVLNHLCSYRRCCNPFHLEQVTSSRNARHGVRVQDAIAEAEAGKTASADNYLSAEELVPYHETIRNMYFEICKARKLIT